MLVLGLVCIHDSETYAISRASRRIRQLSEHVTQSISLSNIKPPLCVEGRPALRLLKPTVTNLAIGDSLLPDWRHLSDGNLEAVNEFGGADRDRTGDPLLAKQVLSQLSYSPLWVPAARWLAWVDSNYRPHPYQGCALTN